MLARPLWALVAIRSSSGKRRLSAVLDDAGRHELVLAMAKDVLGTLAASSLVDGVALTTDDADLAALGRALGARIIPEGRDEEGLNPALAHAREVLMADGAASLLVLHGDVPSVTEADLAAFVAGHLSAVTIAKAEKDGGTNGLLLTPPDAIPFCFGADSCAAHVNAAVKAGKKATVLAIPGLSHDIDEPDDLALLAQGGGAGKAAQFARALAGNERGQVICSR